MADESRLIELAFPLRQASLDSVRKKNVRHGHISTLYIWPARRPLSHAGRRCCLIPATARRSSGSSSTSAGRSLPKSKRKTSPAIASRLNARRSSADILYWGREPLLHECNRTGVELCRNGA